MHALNYKYEFGSLEYSKITNIVFVNMGIRIFEQKYLNDGTGISKITINVIVWEFGMLCERC